MAKTTEKSSSGSRTRARRLAMQAVYQWLLSDAPFNDLESQFLDDPESESANREYMSELLQGTIKYHKTLSEQITPHLDRSLEEVDPVERAVLLIAAFEFSHAPSVPYKVVINEAIELTRTYGAEQAHKFVNGVLDKLARETRSAEMA